MKYAANAHPDIMVKLPGWRATTLFMMLLAGLAALLGRSVYLQGIHNGFLQEKGKARYSRVIEVSAR
jgi:cell division protein FtsI (penicillin-binding protein 3)